MNITNLRTISTLYGTLPTNFVELADTANLSYEFEGDNVYLAREWVASATQDHPLIVALNAAFESYPQNGDIILQPL